MVQLMPIQQSDFEIFFEHAIAEYAQDKIKSGNWLAEEALEKSRNEFNQLLPEGIQTKDQFIFSILDGNTLEKIGVLWVQVKMNEPGRRAFICDFIIDSQFRGQGYGKQALQALDETLVQMKVESVSLHVFAHNTTAIGLYEKMGYSTTNMYMGKNLLPNG